MQVSIDSDPFHSSHQTCDRHYWALQGANYNVLGLADSCGVLAGRCEYTPYGQRQVFASAGTNDPGCYATLDRSLTPAAGLLDYLQTRTCLATSCHTSVAWIRPQG